jgi:hypothetical protein
MNEPAITADEARQELQADPQGVLPNLIPGARPS